MAGKQNQDLLTVKVRSDFDPAGEASTMLQQVVELEGNRTTFCQILVPQDSQRICRVFEVSLRPMRPMVPNGFVYTGAYPMTNGK